MAAGACPPGGPEFAARGYRYMLQACRGTDGSSGSHSYFMEASDGRATADWVARQPWFNGSLGTFGASYMGFTQWALASTRPPHLKAMVVGLAASVRAFSWYPGGSLALEVIIPWDLGATQFNKPAQRQHDHRRLARGDRAADGRAEGRDSTTSPWATSSATSPAPTSSSTRTSSLTPGSTTRSGRRSTTALC